jgi:hypothetical protein
MGYAKILFLFEDAVRDAQSSETEFARLVPIVGDAVLNLCVRPQNYWDINASRMAELRSRAVGPMGNAVNLAGTLHSSDSEVFLWHRNGLRSLSELSPAQLELAASIVKRRQDTARE